ncbi:MAG TPA: ABC transporter ATP-binding protein, partial [bacterium]|nr:ABC transporter ATP-binding protein [bacterium]
MLKVEHLTKMFGGLAAVNDVSVEFEAGKINAIIGPNGAGKSTFFNLISGLHQPTSGRILLDGVDVTHMPSDKVARLGVGRTFQTTNLFEQASVLDNLIVGHRLRTRSGLWDVLINSQRLQREEKAARDKAMEALEFVGLSHVAGEFIADITQEERKRVAFALALATDPKIVLLDEPAAGVNPEETQGFAELMRKMV